MIKELQIQNYFDLNWSMDEPYFVAIAIDLLVHLKTGITIEEILQDLLFSIGHNSLQNETIIKDFNYN